MALQYVGGNTATKAGSTSGNSTISLTALTGGISSSAAAGDFVLAVYATGSAADRALVITDGTTNYTLIGTELYANGTTYDTNLRVAYKLLTAADASVTFGPTGNAADAGAMAVHVWRGVDSSIFDATAVGATGTATGRPDGASISPTTTGAIVIVAGGAAAGTGAVFTSSDLSNFRTATSSDNNDAMVGIGSFAWTSGAFNPAQWGGGTTNAADSWAAITIALKPAVNNFTLTCNGGSYTVAGQSATLKKSKLISASGGSYSLAGQNAVVSRNRTLTSNGGSYALTGQSAGITYTPVVGDVSHLLMEDGFYLLQEDGSYLNKEPLDYIVRAGSGSYTLTGQSAAVARNRVLTAHGGSYSLTGQSATIKRNRALTASGGAYSLTGQTAVIKRNKLITANGGSYSLTGQSVTLSKNRYLTASAGSYSLAGQVATLLKSKRIVASGGAYSLAGQSVTLSRSKLLTASGGSYTLTGQTANLLRNRSLSANGGSYVLTGQTIVISKTTASAYTLTALGGSYTLTGHSVTIKRDRKLTPSNGSYSLTGQTATVKKSKLITATNGSYALTGQSATVKRSKLVTANGGAYSVTGQSVTVKRNRSLTSTGGTYSVTGQQAVITKTTPGAYTLTALGGSYSLSGQSATVSKSKFITAGSGAYVVSGQAADIAYSGAAPVVSTGGSGNGRKKRVYLEIDGKVLVFANAARAAAYIAQEKAIEASQAVTEARSKPVARKVIPKPQKKEIEPLQVVSIDVLQLLAKQFNYEDTLSPILRQHEYAALIALYEQVARDMDEEEVLMLLLA